MLKIVKTESVSFLQTYLLLCSIESLLLNNAEKIICTTIIRGDNKSMGNLALDVRLIFYPLLNFKNKKL